jgi:glutamine amidotransferase
VPAMSDLVTGWSTYGVRFASVIAQDNIYGVQFHPEKSSANGLRLLRNFVAICEARSR